MCAGQTNGRITNASNSPIQINGGYTNFLKFHVVNFDPLDTIKVTVIDTAATPGSGTSAQHIVGTFDMLPMAEYWVPLAGNNRSLICFKGSWVTVTKGGFLGRAITYTTQPSYSPVIEVTY